MNNNARCTEIHYGECADRPNVHGILIPGKRGRLFSVLYTAGGAGPHPTVLLLHGIPGCERNFDLAHALRRAGFHVMTFHYSGSWGSDGIYSLKNDLEDAGTVLDYILADETYGFDKAHIYAVGHSMGGFVCGQLTATRLEIKGAVLLMPCDIGRLPLIACEDPQAYQMVREIFDDSAQWLTGTTGEMLLQEVEENREAFRLENVADRLAEKPLLCVAGTLDIYTPPAQHCTPLGRAIEGAGGRQFQTVSYQTDHFFSDYRLAVADQVIAYLRKLQTE
ncbi:S9 family peptidase [uncultured Dysosmobacter sp.]|uniref:alpha/beta hydrolase family protein n=1 Tax=uncultured Dysosmobacter sp. TaxID=2591384 RepID=UPI002621BE78|nr:alpha/beta fold hydrolase [uncultured Dysosmobacter sp.]